MMTTRSQRQLPRSGFVQDILCKLFHDLRRQHPTIRSCLAKVLGRLILRVGSVWQWVGKRGQISGREKGVVLRAEDRWVLGQPAWSRGHVRAARVCWLPSTRLSDLPAARKRDPSR